ncbi:MAG: sensor histidine kinase, partial [Acidobacteriota bacterium]
TDERSARWGGQLRAGIADAIEGLDRLLRILSSTLDVAESEAGALRLHRRQIHLGNLAREMVSLYQPAAEEQGLSLTATVHGRPMLRADQDLLRRALGNLLDNAIQHVPAGRSIQIVAEEKNEEVFLSVVDDGPGFAPGLAETAFQRFVKGPASRGHGIGLALVRAVARAHGGEATIRQLAGGGAAVQLRLPRQTDTAAASAVAS